MSDPDIKYGSCVARFLKRIWQLRASRPQVRLVISKMDVKNGFRRLGLATRDMLKLAFKLDENYVVVPTRFRLEKISMFV